MALQTLSVLLCFSRLADMLHSNCLNSVSIIHCCISLFGYIASIAAGNSVSPSVNTSNQYILTPRFFNPLSNEIQNFALSFSPSTSQAHPLSHPFLCLSLCILLFYDPSLASYMKMNCIHEYYRIYLFKRS